MVVTISAAGWVGRVRLTSRLVDQVKDEDIARIHAEAELLSKRRRMIVEDETARPTLRYILHLDLVGIRGTASIEVDVQGVAGGRDRRGGCYVTGIRVWNDVSKRWCHQQTKAESHQAQSGSTYGKPPKNEIGARAKAPKWGAYDTIALHRSKFMLKEQRDNQRWSFHDTPIRNSNGLLWFACASY